MKVRQIKLNGIGNGLAERPQLLDALRILRPLPFVERKSRPAMVLPFNLLLFKESVGIRLEFEELPVTSSADLRPRNAPISLPVYFRLFQTERRFTHSGATIRNLAVSVKY